MAWYWWVTIGVVVLILIIINAANKADKKRKEFLADISTWQVGDKLKMTSYYMDEAKKNGIKFPKLVKWDEHEVLVDLGDNMVNLVSYSRVLENRDDFWRMKYASMNKFMTSINKLSDYKAKKDKNGKEVESEMDVDVRDGLVFINDMPLIGMMETYLLIYQKIAMKEGRNNLLTKINEELKKHR